MQHGREEENFSLKLCILVSYPSKLALKKIGYPSKPFHLMVRTLDMASGHTKRSSAPT